MSAYLGDVFAAVDGLGEVVAVFPVRPVDGLAARPVVGFAAVVTADGPAVVTVRVGADGAVFREVTVTRLGRERAVLAAAERAGVPGWCRR